MNPQAQVDTGGGVAQLRCVPRFSESPQRADGSLASLSNCTLSSRFCAWRGASDRRYVASVYTVDREAANAGLPAFEGFVLMAVERGALGRRVLAVSAVERANEREAVAALGLARGAQEWHVHLLAEDRRGRLAMVTDLLDRHGDAPEARRA